MLETADAPKDRISEHIPQEKKLSLSQPATVEGRSMDRENQENNFYSLSVNSFCFESHNGKSCLWLVSKWNLRLCHVGWAFFSFALLTGLLMRIQCQVFDIQDGDMLLWKQLVTAFRFSVAWAGSRQTVPNVLVDSEQNKCGFHQKSLGQICIIRRRLSLLNTEGN